MWSLVDSREFTLKYSLVGFGTFVDGQIEADYVILRVWLDDGASPQVDVKVTRKDFQFWYLLFYQTIGDQLQVMESSQSRWPVA